MEKNIQKFKCDSYDQIFCYKNCHKATQKIITIKLGNSSRKMKQWLKYNMALLEIRIPRSVQCGNSNVEVKKIQN